SSWRHSPSPSTARARVPGAEGAGPVLLTGIFPTSGRIAGRLLEALPPVLHVPHEAQSSHALELVEEELGSCHAGREAMLDWLLDILLIAVLRDGLALPDVHAPAWFGASRDPAVGPALAAMHADPGREWTVGTLAATALVSRATFARRFAELMGEPPISYLAGWRLCLGADLLQERDDTLESIARQVGYSSAYAFSAAFTREYGIRPSRYRERVRGVGAASCTLRGRRARSCRRLYSEAGVTAGLETAVDDVPGRDPEDRDHQDHAERVHGLAVDPAGGAQEIQQLGVQQAAAREQEQRPQREGDGEE